MEYNKTNWKTGDIITANKLNNAEDGIYNNSLDIETQQNTISTLITGINQKMNIDMSNASQASKNTITSYTAPDYARAQTMTSPFTVPCDGWIFTFAYNGFNRWVQRGGFPDASDIWFTVWSDSNIAGVSSYNFVSKGAVLTHDTETSAVTATSMFIPCKGATI